MPPSEGVVTKQEMVYRAVRERILSGAYGPGYRVVIDALADEFDVSGLPVREAIRRLEAEGLVVYRPNAGAQVAPADPGLFDEEMTVLAVLEGYGTALAAPCMGTKEIAQLKAVNDAMVVAMNEMDALRFGQLNQEFHGLI
ncbi:MAG TPA: GntR family transcriptional regulator, partial [Solirubrobacteraceae bacterium]|nr:GntR family transcriptional regulator [Solirubrobacteraceae bacterium]